MTAAYMAWKMTMKPMVTEMPITTSMNFESPGYFSGVKVERYSDIDCTTYTDIPCTFLISFTTAFALAGLSAFTYRTDALPGALIRSCNVVSGTNKRAPLP